MQPGHIAVLVGTNRNAALMRDALDAAGVPAVINGAGSVFGTAIARQWLALLEVLERPASLSRVRAAALTVFLGRSAEQIATADEDEWEHLHAGVHRWADLLRRRGVAALLEAVTHSEDLPARMLSRPGGERDLTDLRHIGQLLHLEAVSEQLGVTALAAWLGRRIADAADDTADEDRSRRLESDSEAVQVLTIHRSKGLEFPVVYCPDLWNRGWIPLQQPPVFHDPAAGDRRTIDVGGKDSPGFDDHWRQHVAEERGEDLRLAYVALTRARHQAVVWWASSFGSRRSPLARLLFEPGTVELNWTPGERQVVDRLQAIAAKAPGTISIERTVGGSPGRWSGSQAAPVRLDVRPFRRRLDTTWRRASYTSLTSLAGEADVASEPETTGIVDEELPTGPEVPGTVDAAGDDEARLRAVPLPLAAMPGGTRTGTLVHAVLETVDFTADDLDLDRELAAGFERELSWRHADIGPTDVVVTGLRAAIETPLGPLVDETRLRDIERGDRLDELAFELPLVGGDEPTAELNLGALAALLDTHVGPGDPLHGYPARLRDPALGQHLRGYLTGSLDAVLRLPGPRFVVVDYKTNWLGVDGDELTAWHYRPSALAAAMHHAHYPLQALFYVVALHRYLRWRLPGYRADEHLAGVLYLFLRGMTGAQVPRVAGQPCGVFAWRPPADLVVAISDLLDRGVAA